jgi:autotransporter-associated beta strand protein
VSNNSDATAALFTVGNNDAISTFTGAIDDSGGTYEVALTKTGAGALTLSGVNNYRGDTTLNAGTLVVNGSLGSASAVAVNTGGTLSGNGTVGGSITLADDTTAVLYPNSSSTLTVGGDIVVDANSTTKFDLSSSAASGNDKVVMENTTLTITGNPQVTINPTGTSLSTADYVLFAVGASGTISGSFNTVPNWTTPPPFSACYSVITVGKTVVLHYTAIPITVTAAANSKTYDGNMSASATPTITSGTLDSGDTGVFTESYDTRNVGSSKTLTPTGTIRDSGNADVTSRYTITWTAANAGTITTATLTYTATGVHRNYGSANPTFSGSITGFASGDNQGNATTGTLTFTSSTTTGTAAGSYALNGSGLTANNGNYTFVQAGGNATALTVDPLPVNLSGSRIYNRLATATASILTIGNNLDGATLTLSGTANLASKNVGTRAISAGTLALGGAAAGNYTLTGLSGSVTITVKDARLTGLSVSDKFYDGTTTATLTGTSTLTSGDVVSGDDVSLVSGSKPTGAFVDRELGSAKSVPYSSAFSLSGADASNYNLVLPSLTASILNHKEDSGTTTNTSANSLTFGLSLNNGKLLADNDPASGSINGAGMITVNATSILGGTGKVGAVTVNSGGTLAPGDTVGTLSTGSETWNTNGAYAFQMSSATGTGGSDWDLVSITGNLNIAATITNAFTVKVYTLSGGTPGQTANFDNTLAYQWPIATVTGSITGFDATKFIVDASQFQNATGSGKFSVKLSSDQKSVNLVFTPSCAVNLTTSTYVLGTDGKVHMYFSNPFGFNTAGGLEARILNNCTITLAMAYGPGFDSGLSLGGLPLTVVGQSTSISAGATRLEVVATKVNGSQSSTVNVEVRDACGGQGNFDPVFTELKVQQGGVVRQSFSDLPAAEHYVGVVNGTPGLAWLSILVNGQVFALNPLADGQSVLLDVGAAMGEGNTNVVVLAGQGMAGASASITIGDLSVVTGALTPVAVVTGTEAQHWSSLAMAAENPVLKIATSGGNIVLSWSDMWDGFSVQTRASMAPEDSWVPVVVTPELANGQFTATVPVSTGMCFRLSNP